MKQVLLALFLLFSVPAMAQFTNMAGVTFHAKEIGSGGERESVNSYYFFSFKDRMLLHFVMTSKSEISDNQFYKITSFKETYSKGDEKTVYTVEALSGVSGSTYKYTITIFDDGTGNIAISDSKYYGNFYDLKTYAQ